MMKRSNLTSGYPMVKKALKSELLHSSNDSENNAYCVDENLLPLCYTKKEKLLVAPEIYKCFGQCTVEKVRLKDGREVYLCEKLDKELLPGKGTMVLQHRIFRSDRKRKYPEEGMHRFAVMVEDSLQEFLPDSSTTGSNDDLEPSQDASSSESNDDLEPSQDSSSSESSDDLELSQDSSSSELNDE